MTSQAPSQTASDFYAAVPIAIDDVDLARWYEIFESQKLNELAAIPPAVDRNAEPEGVYNNVAFAQILLLLHNGGVEQYARRVLRALSQLQQIKRPAVLLIQVTDNASPSGAVQTFETKGLKVQLRDVRKGLEEIISGLKSGAITPLRDFAPQLLGAIMGTREANAPAHSGVGGLGTPKTGQENPSSKAQSGTGGLGSPIPNQEEADEEGLSSDFRFDAFPQKVFSELAWQMLDAARRLGEQRPRPQTSARRLLTAMILSGLRTKGDDRAGSWLVSLIPLKRDEIRSHILKRYPAAARQRGSFEAILRSDLTVSENMTEALHTILETAKMLAAEARPGAPVVIGARHLLGAAVRQDERETSVQRTLRDFRLDVDDIRQQLIEQLPTWGLDDDQEAWHRVLEPLVVAVERRLPTYATDSAVGRDMIGITREVEAMASLVSAWSVEPPLSIGLFGEWGSGKTFFMQKMKERVKEIAVEARKSRLAQRDFGYYKNIVQVEFNAWHYVEGNLWASLVEHIFNNLRFEGTQDEDLDSEKNINDRLKKMLQLLRDRTADADAKDREAAALHAAANAAEQTATNADKLAADAKATADTADRDSTAAMHNAVQKQASAQDTSEIRRSMLAKDVVEEIQLSPEVRTELEAGLDQLGITKERLKTVQGVRDALREATETGTEIAQGFTLLRQNAGWLLLFWAVAVPVAVIVLGYGVDLLSNARWVQRIGNLVSIVSGLMTGFLVWWKKLSPNRERLLELIRKMKAKRVELEARVEAERQKRATEAAKLEQDVIKKQSEAEADRRTAAVKAAEALKARQDAENRRAEAEKAAKAAAETRAAAEKLAREAESLRPERRIATFIQDRAAATDYRRHLGVPALIRRDFEKLSSMFQTQREAEENREDCGTKNEHNDPSIVNRVILYIDDLDRCPPQKVVEVLRAIHLLLAFKLFVVVVAVDARWMKRSLKDQFTLMLTTTDTRRGAAETDGAGRNNGAPEHVGWRATASPDDYLEKIFQVPFWIRPLGRSGTRRLVTELTRGDVDPGQQSGAGTDGKGSTGKQDDGHGMLPDSKQASSENRVDLPSGGSVSDVGAKDPVPGTPTASEKKPDGGAAPKVVSEFSPVEPKPRTLMLTPEERDYMVSLSLVIGRSPRSVKRFVNCYRLLKSTLDPAELDRAKRSGTFRTFMLLLGIVTGFPEAAPALLTDLRDAKRDQTPEAWARAAAKRLQLEDRGKWAELLPVISRLRQWDVNTIAPLVDAATLVDRFSFSPVQRPVEELV
jgi:KAP family P-loop domain